MKLESLMLNKMQNMKPCPKCKSLYGYSLGNEIFACPECSHEWNPDEVGDENILKVLDSNGNELANGDSVIIIKNLPVKGAPKPIKSGTKVKNIRLTDGDHNIDCKIDGFGMMEKAQKNFQTGLNQLDEVMDKRTRAIQRKLKGVETLSEAETKNILPEIADASLMMDEEEDDE